MPRSQDIDFEKADAVQIEVIPKEKRQIVYIEEVESTSSHRPSVRREPLRPSPPKEHISVFKSPKRWWRQNYLSWRFYVTIYAGLALLALFVNVVGFAAAVVAHGVDDNGRITLFNGNCGHAKTSSLFAHWFISGIGTYLLSASAYVMYCLTPPTREEIDKAHAKGDWLDIGAMSFRNMRKVSKKRIFLFCCLGLSSPLIQLFYNSVFFVTYSANAYSAIVAHESFRNPDHVPTIQIADTNADATHLGPAFDKLVYQLWNESNHNELEYLSGKQCIDEYSQPLQAHRRHVVLVVDDQGRNPADVFDVFHAWIPTANRTAPEQYSWICDDHDIPSDSQCLYHVQNIREAPGNWTVSGGAKVKYCLSEKTKEHCKIHMSVNMSLTVIVVNLFKVIVMLAAAFWVPETPLMTTGDAINSFLNKPDPYTEDMCMATKKMIRNNPKKWLRQPQHYSSQRYRWWDAIKGRMYYVAALMMFALCLAGFNFFLMNEPPNFKDLLTLGFGTINRRYFIGWNYKSHTSTLRSVMVANIGHAVFGMLYIIYNNVFYCMSFQAEWSRYALHKKGLRVSEAPRGMQRTVYFFLMPYKLAIPIICFSVVIHALISQTTFLVDVEAYGHNMDIGQSILTFTRQPSYDFNATGFSPLGNIAVITVGFLMILYMLGMGMRKFKSGIPNVSTCSAAISAACHPAQHEEEGVELLKIQWGVTDYGDGVSHCTFSARDVKAPDEMTLYA